MCFLKKQKNANQVFVTEQNYSKNDSSNGSFVSKYDMFFYNENSHVLKISIHNQARFKFFISETDVFHVSQREC